MNKTKWIVRVAMCVALLIGGQLALTGLSGIEIVTVMLLCFCFCYGIRQGVAIATTFSLVRCLVFGFQINVIVLYLVYYNVFALFFGWLGKRITGRISLPKLCVIVASAMVFTVLFTMLDNVITPLIFAFHKNAAAVYFAQSLYALVPQTICTMVTVSILFVPLTKILQKIS